jgi:hypothetical protein
VYKSFGRFKSGVPESRSLTDEGSDNRARIAFVLFASGFLIMWHSSTMTAGKSPGFTFPSSNSVVKILYEMITIVLLEEEEVDEDEEDEDEEEEEEAPIPVVNARAFRLSNTSVGIDTLFVEIIVTFFSSKSGTHFINSSFQFKQTALGEIISKGHFSLK